MILRLNWVRHIVRIERGVAAFSFNAQFSLFADTDESGMRTSPVGHAQTFAIFYASAGDAAILTFGVASIRKFTTV